MQFYRCPWSLALGDGNNGVCTAILHDGNGIPGHLSKAKVPIGCLRVAVPAPVHSQHPMICTQALGQGLENCVSVTPTRQTQKGRLTLARVIVEDAYSV